MIPSFGEIYYLILFSEVQWALFPKDYAKKIKLKETWLHSNPLIDQASQMCILWEWMILDFQSHSIRQPSKTPFKASFKRHFFGIMYPYPLSGALTIYDCMRPALRRGYLMLKKWFLNGALKKVLEGCLIKQLGP